MLDTIPFTSVHCNLEHGLTILTESFGGSYCPDQAFSIRTRGGTGEFPVGEISRPQTADSYG